MSRYCSQCGKSLKACICQWVQSLPSNVELIILQHPSEAKRPMGTARILTLCLSNSYCFVGENFTDHSQLNQLLSESDYRHFVLYPGEQAIELTQLESQSTSTKQKYRVILLDGTWKKAFKMWQLSTNLHSLAQVKLPNDLKGNYRIRKAPSDNALSTVEAGYYVLQGLEPERDFSPLLVAFEQMIEFQIAQMPAGVFEKNYRQ